MYLELCTREQAIEIFAEFGATEETVREDVLELKNWLKTQSHLPNVEDDKQLTSILMRCKNHIKKAKKFLNDYYTGRVEFASDMFAFRDPTCPEIRDSFNVSSSLPAPKMTPDGYRICYLTIYEHAAKDVPSADVFLSALQIASDVSMKDDLNRGFIVIVDTKNISMPLCTLFFRIARKLVVFTTKLNRARVHRLYFVNVTAEVRIFLRLFRTMLKKDLAQRIHVWNKDPNDLTEVLPKNVLSSTYGGDDKPIEQLKNEYYEYLVTFRDWLEAEKNIKADLSKKMHVNQSFSSYLANIIGGNEELIEQ